MADRETLIDAAARRMVDDETLLVHTRPLVGAVLDALVSPIAELLEARADELQGAKSATAVGAPLVASDTRAAAWAMAEAARLVRSLGGNDRSSSE